MQAYRSFFMIHGVLDPLKLRSAFPILEQKVNGHPLIYFDNAATTQKPESVIRALGDYYLRDNSNVHRGLHELSARATQAYEGARERVARFIHAPATEGVIFVRGTTEAINLVANAWATPSLKPGDRVLLTAMEHHSNIVPWQILAQHRQLQIEYVPLTPDTRLDLAALEHFLQPPTRLFAFTHISNTLGVINPAAQLCAMARSKGVVTLVDAAQSCGHMSVDMEEIGADFLAFSAHKMCGPTGIGVLAARPERLKEMVPWQGGGEMISTVNFESSEWKPAPYKFEAGTPAIAEAIGLAAACDYLDEVGRDAVHEHDKRLGAYAYERFSRLAGVRILGPRDGRSGIVSFVLQDVHAHDIVEVANRRGLALRGGHHCNQPLMRMLGTPSTARASFYLYNTVDEVDQAVEIIEEVTRFFTNGTA